MHLSIDLPDPKPGLDASVAKQFADIQHQLMGLIKSQQTSQNSMRTDFMSAMKSQQNSLVDAMSKLLAAVSGSSNGSSMALADALKGMKDQLRSLPADLQTSIDRRFQSIQNRSSRISIKPQVTVSLPKTLEAKIDGLTEAMLHQPTGMRNRTFGSNF